MLKVPCDDSLAAWWWQSLGWRNPLLGDLILADEAGVIQFGQQIYVGLSSQRFGFSTYWFLRGKQSLCVQRCSGTADRAAVLRKGMHITERPNSHNKRGSVCAPDSNSHHRHGTSTLAAEECPVLKSPILCDNFLAGDINMSY